ncbi:MAG: hypothetical protein WBG46_07890 [Nonlabens sp.]
MRLTKFPCKLLHLYALLSIHIYAFVQIAKHQNLTDNSFILFYLNDLLIIPLVLTAALNVVWLIKKNKTIQLGILSIFSVFALYSYYFEYYLPEHTERYTADIYDIVCYGIGSVVFYILQRLP